MKNIKFRVWDIDHEKMIAENVGINKIYLYDFDGDGITEQEGLVIMQYIGIKDGNGKEIYDGDIVKITYHTHLSENPFYIGQVQYGASEGYPAFDLSPWIDCEMNALSWLKSESDESVINYEVIGNIYESPELLELAS